MSGVRQRRRRRKQHYLPADRKRKWVKMISSIYVCSEQFFIITGNFWLSAPASVLRQWKTNQIAWSGSTSALRTSSPPSHPFFLHTSDPSDPRRRNHDKAVGFPQLLLLAALETVRRKRLIEIKWLRLVGASRRDLSTACRSVAATYLLLLRGFGNLSKSCDCIERTQWTRDALQEVPSNRIGAGWIYCSNLCV